MIRIGESWLEQYYITTSIEIDSFYPSNVFFCNPYLPKKIQVIHRPEYLIFLKKVNENIYLPLPGFLLVVKSLYPPDSYRNDKVSIETLKTHMGLTIEGK